MLDHNGKRPFARAPSLILGSAFVLLCLTLVDPKIRMPKSTFRYLFVLDITQSMNVNDMSLRGVEMTRLDYAKTVLATAIKSLPCGSEASLGIFAAHRTFVIFAPVEICEHYRPIVEMLGKINWQMAWLARSEVAKGLYSAIDSAWRLQNDTHLVFLTDGHEAPPLHQSIRPAFRGADRAVSGLVAGVGGLIPTRIPHLNLKGEVVGYWSHEDVMQIDVYSVGRGSGDGEAMAGINMANIARRIALGQEHLSSLRETHLTDLATQTNLDYVHVDSPAKFVAALQTQKYARHEPVRTGVGWIPAMFALIILAYGFVLLPLRNRTRPPSGDAPVQ